MKKFMFLILGVSFISLASLQAGEGGGCGGFKGGDKKEEKKEEKK
jgi:hypothetical protein